MKLMFITNDVNIAIEAEKSGIDRIFIDLEINGKFERQGHLDTHISDHKMEDVENIKKCIKKSKILVRINPFYEKTQEEIENCIRQGADIIMLPMFKNRKEVKKFIEYINGRAIVCLLLETAQALVRIDQILEIKGINEVYIGLNDLHISLGLDFMFELLSEGIIESLAEKLGKANIKFGFGGIAKIGEGEIPAELIIGEHYRLNSEIVILSRTFRNSKCPNESNSLELSKEIEKIRIVENKVLNWTKEDFEKNNLLLKEKVRCVAERKQSK